LVSKELWAVSRCLIGSQVVKDRWKNEDDVLSDFFKTIIQPRWRSRGKVMNESSKLDFGRLF